MQILDNKALLLRLKDPTPVLTTIQNSKKTGPHEVVVKWDVPEVHRLRSFNIRAPSPIEGRYNWPGLYKPFDHQKTTAAFLTNHQRAFCFSEPGTGKTGSAIWAADFLMTRGIVSRVLVVCPMSIMDSAWRDDLFTFAMHRRVDVAHGSADKRRKIIASDAEFVILNFDGVGIVEKELKDGGFDLIIVDEASAYQNANTKRWKALKRLIEPHTWLWMMTGTPAAQGPLHAYGLAKLVNPGGTPRTYTAWRDAVMEKVGPFRWEPKPHAVEMVHQVLQPAVRFTKEECLDLPDMLYVKRKVEMTSQQKAYYKELKKKHMMTAAEVSVTAANAAVMMNKLLQVACIAENTPVLCQRGWVPIQKVTAEDRVWDGEAWVECCGTILKGTQPTIALDGVDMTPDHLVMTKSGWATAEECLNGNASERFNRPTVRIPDGYQANGQHRREVQKSGVALPVRLWEDRRARIPKPQKPAPPEREALRLPAESDQSNAWDEQHARVSNMDTYASPVQRREEPGLPKLRGPWDQGLRALAIFLRSLLGRHGGVIPGRANFGSNRQRWAVFPGELSVGYRERTVEQHEVQPQNTDSGRRDDCFTSSRALWDKAGDSSSATDEIQLASGKGPRPTKVYDLVNCGPRNRFVVQGEGGQLLIVHNCGAAYGDDGSIVEFDISKRYNVLREVIDETPNKVLVFVPYQHSIEIISEKLASDGISCGVISGAVSAGKRTDLFKRFQTQPDPRVLVIQPQAAAHGVTLTAADTIVWWSPTPSLEIYEQANARIHRSGQKNHCTVVQLSGSAVEARVYHLLDKKIDVHSKVIELYKNDLD